MSKVLHPTTEFAPKYVFNLYPTPYRVPTLNPKRLLNSIPAPPTASTAASRMEEGEEEAAAEAAASSSLSGGPGDSGSDLAVAAVAEVCCSCRSPAWNPNWKQDSV